MDIFTLKKQEIVKFIILLGLVLLSNTTVFGQNDADTEIKRSLATARAAYKLGEYQDALNEYLKVSKLAPDFSDIYKAIGDAYEKIGGEDNLQKAADSYKHYLSLSPNAGDKDSIQEKIYQLEYLSKKQAEKDFILDDINGLWVSNLVNISDKKQREDYFSSMAKKQKLSNAATDRLKADGILLDTCYRVDPTLSPLLLFQISEMGKTGKYRVTILNKSAFYKETIIQKTVNIVPDKKNSVRFTFADEARYMPSQAKWNFLRIAGSIAGQAIGGVGGQITEGLTNTLVDVGSESDIPSNAQTVYDFELQYKDGQLVGYCYVVSRQSSAKAEKETQNDFYEISFWKDNDYMNKLQQMEDKKELEKQRRKANKPVSFGFHAGFNSLSYSYSNQRPLTFDEDISAIGFKGGVFLEFRISDLISIQPGANIGRSSVPIYYSGQVDRAILITEAPDIVNFEGYYYDNSATIIEFPLNLLFKYNINNRNRSRIYAGVGPMISYVLSSSNDIFSSYGYNNQYNLDGEVYSVLTKNVVKFTGVNIGLDFKIGFSVHKFFLEFGYNAGMSNVSLNNDVNVKRNSFFGSLGLRF